MSNFYATVVIGFGPNSCVICKAESKIPIPVSQPLIFLFRYSPQDSQAGYGELSGQLRMVQVMLHFLVLSMPALSKVLIIYCTIDWKF